MASGNDFGSNRDGGLEAVEGYSIHLVRIHFQAVIQGGKGYLHPFTKKPDSRRFRSLPGCDGSVSVTTYFFSE